MNTIDEAINIYNFLKIIFRINNYCPIKAFPCPSKSNSMGAFLVLVVLLAECGKLCRSKHGTSIFTFKKSFKPTLNQMLILLNNFNSN